MLIVDDLLINLPVKGFFGLFKKIHDMAVDELYDPQRIQEQLLTLQELYDAGEIRQEEYEKKEAELLERLSVAKGRR